MSSISSLIITREEVARVSHIDLNYINFIYSLSISQALVWVYSFIFYGGVVYLSGIILIGLFLTLEFGFIAILLAIPIGIILLTINKQQFENMVCGRRSKFWYFLSIYKQVRNFNSLIEQAEILDYSGRLCQQNNRLEDREKILEALSYIRDDLIFALRIEKAFRENRNFSPNSFPINLKSLQFLQLSESSSEYGRLFNEALQIGMNVQQEMQTLQRR